MIVGSAKLLKALRRRKRLTALFPIVVLMAEEASILGLTHLCRFAVVAFLARLDAGN